MLLLAFGECEHSWLGRDTVNLATIWQQHWRCQPNAATMLLAEKR